MIDTIKTHLQDVEVYQASSLDEVEQFRIAYLGKKGHITQLFADFRNVPNEEKKEYGQLLNQLKTEAQTKVKELQTQLSGSQTPKGLLNDITRPGQPIALGARHPISIVRDKVIDVFSRIGYGLSSGPEVEDDWHNFSALNLPEHHPARDMQDTFFVQTNPDVMLRTHTSSVQVRHMEANRPPIRILSPGRVFRNEAISARSHCVFHQVEGLYIDKNVSFADLKQTLMYFTKAIFGTAEIRLRPSYFPFTEPSAEVDIYWGLETEADYRITKGTGWLEIMGCGMVDPQVLKNCNIDPEEYSGFAFGMGLERMAMLLYQIEDIRMFYENDVRFLKQFTSIS
ncbi:MAG: phenylalanine--tRNA ligase subunit alpha [Flavobacteriaceae bacterium]|nr:phenylalanine--tRNA ligase subunit alpha [Flavobacteriaceae bacterium]